MSIGKTIKEKRIELGLTQKEVADYIGVTEATVSRWESANISNMRRDRIAKLATILKMSPADIMGINSTKLKEIPKVPPNATPIDDLVSELFADRPDILALLTNGVYDDEGIYAGKKLADLSEPAKEHLRDTILTILKLSGYVKT